jgi:hypothetical protein
LKAPLQERDLQSLNLLKRLACDSLQVAVHSHSRFDHTVDLCLTLCPKARHGLALPIKIGLHVRKVKALNQGTKDTIASPQKALELLKANDPMMKLDIEKVRLDIALGLTNTQSVLKNGLSSVTPEKLQKTIDAMVSAYQLPVSPDPATVYTDRFLPPPAERMPPKPMN